MFALASLFLASPAGAVVNNAYRQTIDSASTGHELLAPQYLAVDSTGNLYESAEGSSEVVVLSETGEFRFAFDGSGTPEGAMTVTGLASVPGGGVWVADGGAGILRFDASGHYVGRIEASAGPKGIAYAYGVATDAAGNVYVADIGNLEVEKFNPSGAFQLSFGGSEVPKGQWIPARITIAPSGEILVADFEVPGPIQRFDSSGKYLSQITRADAPVLDLAANKVGEIYAAAGIGLARYDAGGTSLGTVDSRNLPEGSLRPSAVAIGAGGEIFVGSIGARAIYRFSSPVTLPGVEATGGARGAAEGDFTLTGSVDPSGLAVDDCHFAYGLKGSGTSTSVPCAEGETQIGVGNAPVPVHAELTGLAVGKYEVRLIAANANGFLRSDVAEFEVIGRPVISATSAEPGYREALLRAEVNPNLSSTTYRFEYGLTAAYGSSTAPGTVVAGLGPVTVAGQAVSLEPDTTYHFRIVAENASGSTAGPDATFTTEDAFDGCANRELRTGLSARLPECRAYEQVTPVDKRQAVVGTIDFQASPDGERLLYSTVGARADAETPASPLLARYMSWRTPSEWRQFNQVDAPSLTRIPYKFLSTLAASEDLSRALVVSDKALTPGAYEAGCNLYLRDIASGSLTLVAASPDSGGVRTFDSLNEYGKYVGGTPDFSKVIFVSPVAFLPAAEAFPGVDETYEWSATGGLRLLSAHADGSAMEASSQIDPEFLYESQRYSPRTGVAVFGVGPGPDEGVYAGGGSTATFPLSVSQIPGASKAPHAGEAIGIGEDGRYAIFLTLDGVPLTNVGSSTPGNVYRYDFETGVLEALGITIFEGGLNGGVLGMSKNLGTFYYRAPSSTVVATVKVWREGTVHTVVPRNPLLTNLDVSPDGRYLAIQSREQFTSFDNEGHSEVYLYDAGSDQTSCASCPKAPAKARGDASLANSKQEYGANYLPRQVADSGTVYFTTSDPLVPADANEQADVYRYSNGSQSLLSGGDAGFSSIFLEAGVDGRDVFFKTAEQLVPGDVDNQIDVYDARIGGGLASQHASTPVPCVGEACQGEASAESPGSFNGLGSEATTGRQPRKTKSKGRKCGRRVAGVCKGKHRKSKKKHRPGKHRAPRDVHRKTGGKGK